jgi:hypothetical protein
MSSRKPIETVKRRVARLGYLQSSVKRKGEGLLPVCLGERVGVPELRISFTMWHYLTVTMQVSDITSSAESQEALDIQATASNDRLVVAHFMVRRAKTSCVAT